MTDLDGFEDYFAKHLPMLAEHHPALLVRQLAQGWLAAKAAPQPAVPEGFVLVPREPTPEMLRAVDDEASDKHLARGRAYSAWKAMLAAAPEPK